MARVNSHPRKSKIAKRLAQSTGKKPTYAVEVDWTHEFAPDIGWWATDAKGVIRDYLNNDGATETGTNLVAQTYGGMEFNGSSSTVNVTGDNENDWDISTDNTTFCFKFRCDNSTSTNTILSKGGGAPNGFNINVLGNRLYFKATSSDYSTNTLTDGVEYLGTIVCTSSGATFYVDGVNVTGVGALTSYNGANTADLHIGSQTGSANPFNGLIDDIRWFNREFTAEEAARYCRNRWQALKPAAPKPSLLYTDVQQLAWYPQDKGRVAGKKPVGQVEIDWQHPLARGLAACYIWDNGGFYDLVTKGELNNIRAEATHVADYIDLTTHDGVTFGNPFLNLMKQSEYAFVSLQRETNSSNDFQTRMMYAEGISSPDKLYFETVGTTGVARIRESHNYSATGFSASSTIDCRYTGWHLIIGQKRQGNMEIHVDGVDSVIGSTVTLTADVVSSAAYLFNGDNTTVNDWFGGNKLFYIYKNRSFSAAEVAELNKNPYAFIKNASEIKSPLQKHTQRKGIKVYR